VSERHVTPAYHEEDRFLEFLTEHARQWDHPILFPTDDHLAVLLARHREFLAKGFVVPGPEWSTMEKVIDKSETCAAAQEAGIPVPASFFPTDVEELRERAASLRYPCVLKPRVGHVFQRMTGRKLFVVREAGTLIRLATPLLREGHRMMVQEIVPGDDDAIYVYAAYHSETHETRAEFTGRKVRQIPRGYGTTRVLQGVPCPQVLQLGRSLLAALRYSGLSDVEFKFDARDGTYKLIEVNPRSGKWIGCAIASGVDLPWAMYSDLVEGTPREMPQRSTKGLYWIHLYDDLLAPVAYWRDEVRRLRGYLSPYRSTKVFAVFDREDLGPFLAEWRNLPFNLIRRIGRRIVRTAKKTRVNAATTGAQEELPRPGKLPILDGAPRVVFVGTQTNGKSCLSLLRMISEGFHIVLVISDDYVKRRNVLVRRFASWPSVRDICAANRLPLLEMTCRHSEPAQRRTNRNLLAAVERIEEVEPDYILSATWHWLIDAAVIRLARHYALNCHSSLLPKYAGVCPTKAPLINCDPETGATLHVMTPGIDEGDIVCQRAFPLRLWDVPQSVYLKICRLAPEVICRGLKSLIDGTARLSPQPDDRRIYTRRDCKRFWRMYFANRIRRALGLRAVKI
jgi:D-aspartate ligase